MANVNSSVELFLELTVFSFGSMRRRKKKERWHPDGSMGHMRKMLGMPAPPGPPPKRQYTKKRK
jgi:hypothetical protein